MKKFLIFIFIASTQIINSKTCLTKQNFDQFMNDMLKVNNILTSEHKYSLLSPIIYFNPDENIIKTDEKWKILIPSFYRDWGNKINSNQVKFFDC